MFHKSNVFIVAVSAAAYVNAGPLNFRQLPASSVSVAAPAPSASASAAPGGNVSFDALASGNKLYRDSRNGAAVNGTNSTSPFYFIGCTDSKTREEQLFNATAGSLNGQNNLGNIYNRKDRGIDTSMSYSIVEGGVKHVFILGHYGCSTVKSVMTGKTPYPKWLSPIQKVLHDSKRQEITQFLKQKSSLFNRPIEENDPAFMALVEESVKASVKSVAEDSPLFSPNLNNHPTCTGSGCNNNDQPDTTNQAAPSEVWVHGLVVNETSGEIFNLDVSKSSMKNSQNKPQLPFGLVKNANQGPAIVTQTVTVEQGVVTVTASIAPSKPVETVQTTVQGKDVTVTVSNTLVASASASAAPSALSQIAAPAVVTHTTIIQQEPVTVTATVSANKSEETVLTTVKGQDVTITVTNSQAAPSQSGAAQSPIVSAPVSSAQVSIQTVAAPVSSAPVSSSSVAPVPVVTVTQ